jgi:hypothetical protein
MTSIVNASSFVHKGRIALKLSRSALPWARSAISAPASIAARRMARRRMSRAFASPIAWRISS